MSTFCHGTKIKEVGGGKREGWGVGCDVVNDVLQIFEVYLFVNQVN